MLKKRQDEWLMEQITIARKTYPELCADLDDEALGERLEALFEKAIECGIGLSANHQRFAHLALEQNDDEFYVSKEWAAVIFAWDADENMKLSACEQHLANVSDGNEVTS